ncbi:hypothetical protein [Frigoribacterium sp. RIT-PI-h]|uniref:hypothetical protein n=1 Tax=Frigoribacterium sp. RIT-PI-h TaxID=1690245 RepID=UPI0006B8A149|nr:hypothetical protein [Frigoribacterium sp. RIT-PI-h]KPG79855.1 hypothetical protein AEQ27_13075 [Frigoribacterium sp. RIT-PI-h]
MDHDTNEPTNRTPEEEAAALALAVVSQAAAITQGDPAAVEASDENLREVVAELTDQPLTPRQEDVVATLGVAGGSLAAGLTAALAHEKGVDPGVILGSTSQAIVAQTQSPFVGADDDGDDDPDLVAQAERDARAHAAERDGDHSVPWADHGHRDMADAGRERGDAGESRADRGEDDDADHAS